MCLNHPSDRWSHSKWLRAPNHAHHVVHGVQVAAGTQRHVGVDQVVDQAQDLRRQVLKGKCGFNQQKVVNLRLPSGNLTWLLNMAIEIVDLPIENGDFP